jgi:hypothetical protein
MVDEPVQRRLAAMMAADVVGFWSLTKRRQLLRKPFLGIILCLSLSPAFARDRSHPGDDVENGIHSAVGIGKDDRLIPYSRTCHALTTEDSDACAQTTAPGTPARHVCVLKAAMNYGCNRDDTTELLHRVTAGPTSMTWTFNNYTRQALVIKFYSQFRRHYWSVLPFNSANGGIDYNIQCMSGEYICFGAVNKSKATYWGVGDSEFNAISDTPGDNKQACDNCCFICGQDNPTYNLNP